MGQLAREGAGTEVREVRKDGGADFCAGEAGMVARPGSLRKTATETAVKA